MNDYEEINQLPLEEVQVRQTSGPEQGIVPEPRQKQPWAMLQTVYWHQCAGCVG